MKMKHRSDCSIVLLGHDLFLMAFTWYRVHCRTCSGMKHWHRAHWNITRSEVEKSSSDRCTGRAPNDCSMITSEASEDKSSFLLEVDAVAKLRVEKLLERVHLGGDVLEL